MAKLDRSMSGRQPRDIFRAMEFVIPDPEITFRASRASGPGGQHVNKVSTRIEARWSVRGSTALSPEQRARLLDKLARRLDSRGILRVTASEYRSQLRNREAATLRLNEIVNRALRVPKARKATRPPRVAHEARLRAKTRRGHLKRERTSRPWDD